jgi:hypothetical protein
MPNFSLDDVYTPPDAPVDNTITPVIAGTPADTSYTAPDTQAAVQAGVDSGAITPELASALSGNYGGYTTGSSGNATTNNQATAEQMAYANKDSPPPQSMLDRINNWGNNNKSNPFLLMALAGVVNAQKNQYNKEAAATQQDYKLAQMEKDAQIAKDKIAANSASVSGIKPTQGIIASALKRLNGTDVFLPNGRVA